MDVPQVGFRASSHYEVTEARVRAFGEASGDFNPLHFDEAFAARTRFGGRIAHGMLSAALISAALVEGFGSSERVVVYLGQQLAFKRPVRIGDAITVQLEVLAADPESGRLTVSTTCLNQVEKAVVEGEATILLDPVKPV